MQILRHYKLYSIHFPHSIRHHLSGFGYALLQINWVANPSPCIMLAWPGVAKRQQANPPDPKGSNGNLTAVVAASGFFLPRSYL